MELPPSLREALGRLSPSLRDHMERVSHLAQKMAEALGIDKEKAGFAGLVHDLMRETPPDKLLDEARRHGFPIHPVEKSNPFLLHGPVAAARLEEMGIKDAEILEAVRWHTTGKVGLGPVGKVVFLADKLDFKAKAEPKMIGKLKTLALKNLDLALLEYLTNEIMQLLKQGSPIHPASIEFRNSLLL